MIILQALLAPPLAPKYEIHRKVVSRSVRWLQRQHSAVVGVLAPAGFGKTSFLRQFHLEMRAASQSTAWISLRGVELDEDSLLVHVVKAFQLAGIDVVDAGQTAQPRALTVLQIQSAIERSKSCVTLFLDDVDALSPPLARVVEKLLSLELKNLKIVFSARRTPTMRLGRIQTSGRLLRVSQADLLLSFVDMHELFRKRSVNAPDVFMVGSQYRLTQGWPALIQLLVQSHLFRLPALPGPGMAHANGDLAAYLSEEVLAGCGEDELQLLRLVSLVGEIDPHSIGKIFAPSDLPIHINDILASNPIFERPPDIPKITINPILADYVKNEMEMHNPAQFKRLSVQLAEWYERNGEPDRAIDHFIDANEFDRAIVLLGREGRRVTLDGVPDRCISWIDRLPRQHCDLNPGLLMAEAWARIAMYDLTRGAELVQRVRKFSNDGDDFGTDLELCLAQAFRYAMKDDFETAYRVVQSGFRTQNSPDSAFVHAGHSNFCAWHSITNGRFDEGRAELYRASCFSPEAQGHLAWVYGTLGIAEAYSLEGDMVAADAEYGRIVAVAEARRGYSSVVAVSAVGPWLDILYEMNQIDEIHSLLIGRLDLMFRACLPSGLANGISAVAKALFLSGSDGDAIALLRRLEEVGESRSLQRLRAVSLATQIWIMMKKGGGGQEQLLLNRLSAMADDKSGLGGSGQGTVNFLSMISRCRVGARLDANRVIRELEEQLQILQNTPWRRSQLTGMALLASISWECGATDRAVDVLSQCIEIAAPLHIKHTIMDDIDSCELLEAPALVRSLGPAGNQLRKELVGMCSRDRGSTYKSLGNAETGPDEQSTMTTLPTFTGREREILFLIERGLSVKHIARALEISPDTVKFHFKNIYQKLGVHDRVAACEAVRRMQLFA